MRHILVSVALGALSVLSLAACGGQESSQTPIRAGGTAANRVELPATTAVGDGSIGSRLFSGVRLAPVNPDPALNRKAMADPVVVDGRFVVSERVDVPCQRDGVLLVIGTEVAEGEDVPADRLVIVKYASGEKRYRRLKEGDFVRVGQVIGQIDDRLAVADSNMKAAKIPAAVADLRATKKTCDEAKERYLARIRSRDSDEEIRGAKLTWERYDSEIISKDKAVELAKLEKEQSDVVVEQHRITSPVDGQIKTIFKRRGEAVKALETVFQIQSLDSLRLEGLVDVQYRWRLRQGLKVYVEPSLPISSVVEFKGHLQEITCVAVSYDAKNPLIVSGSDDNTLRVWEGRQRREKAIFVHPQPVRAVACNPAIATGNFCLTGCADGKARLYDLASGSDQPIREFGKSGQPISSVAFSPDGKTCATGGEDREINLWDVASGAFRYRLPSEHKSGITSLQFLPDSQLVSAARDRSLVFWQLGDSGAKKIRAFENRNGEVTTLGASPDGKLVLFDQGKALRIMTLAGGFTEAVLQNSASASTFATLAIWSPDGQRILTGTAGDGRLQLWRSPLTGKRICEQRQIVSAERTPFTCAAFSPDGGFIVTGNRERQVMVWPVPPAAELDHEIVGAITLLDADLQAAARQMRLWADVPNADGKLLSGGTAKMVIYPEKEDE